VDPARDAKLFAAGYLETRAISWAILNTKGTSAYAAGTSVHYSQTVRNPEGMGSGWAGVMHTDWSKVDVPRLAARALRKCVASINPRAIEPGRYTVILEPNATARMMIFAVSAMDRLGAERGENVYAGAVRGTTRIGERVFDEKITISTDPTDPNCLYIPFDGDGYPYRPVTWVEKGVLKELAYDSAYAQSKLGTDVPLLNSCSFRISGGDTSIEEMIATTERGVLVSHFDHIESEDPQSVQLSTVTRDGVWLIERGKITFPVKNMRVIESPMFIGANVLQLGKSERVLSSAWTSNSWLDLDNYTTEALGNIPIVAPPMKVRDFNFVSLADAV
jgi:predicted Zn-dependent protease